MKKELLKYTGRPTQITHKIFDKNYAAIYEIKPALILNKPIYVGFTVVELSKRLMYDFHYRFIIKHFDGELLFTKTVLLMKKNQKMFMKNLLSTSVCLISVTIQKIQSFLMRRMKKVLKK